MILGATEQTLTGMNIFINDATGIFLSTRNVRNVLNRHPEKTSRGDIFIQRYCSFSGCWRFVMYEQDKFHEHEQV